MQKEAEKHADEDKKRKEEIETVNSAEQLVYQTKKTLDENKDKVDQKVASGVIEKINELDEMLKAEKRNVPKIKEKMDEIQKEAQSVFSGRCILRWLRSSKQRQVLRKDNPKEDSKPDDNVVDVEAEEKEV